MLNPSFTRCDSLLDMLTVRLISLSKPVDRPLKRAIQNYVEDLIAEEIVKSKINEGSSIKIDHDSKSLKLKIIKL